MITIKILTFNYDEEKPLQKIEIKEFLVPSEAFEELSYQCNMSEKLYISTANITNQNGRITVIVIK